MGRRRWPARPAVLIYVVQARHWCRGVVVGERAQGARGREEGEGVGADGLDKDEMAADGAGIGVGEMSGEEGGKAAEGAGRVMAVGGAEDEGVVGAAVGARGPEQGAQHGSSL